MFREPPVSPAGENWPTITIDGQILRLEFSTLTEHLLDSQGLDLRAFLHVAAAQKPGRLSMSFRIFSALVAHHFVAQQQPIPSPEYWALRLATPDAVRELVEKVAHAVLIKLRPVLTPEARAKLAQIEKANLRELPVTGRAQ
jgi:hypothetical protein